MSDLNGEIGGPLDPILFREAVTALLDWIDEWSQTNDEPFDIDLGAPMFLMNHFGARGGLDPKATDLYVRCSFRCHALFDLLLDQGVTLGGFCTEVKEGREIHVAIIEAAAVVPMRHGRKFDPADIVAEASPRVLEINVLEQLVGRS